MGNQVTEDELKTLAAAFSTERSEYADLLDNPKELYNYVERKYAERVVKAKQVVEEGKRMAEGMQITIYMLPGTEKAHQELLGDIENILLENNIRPGSIYRTDRPIGQFSSVRHPGADYHDAVAADSYNPDNAPDNFEELITKQIQDYENKLQQNINILKSFKISDNMSETEKHNVQVKNTLGGKLEEKLNVFSNKNIQGKIQELNTLKNDCISEAKASDQQLKNDKEWKPLLKNLALLFSGIGTFTAIVSIGYRLATGRYGLFDNKENLFNKQSKSTDAPDEKPISTAFYKQQMQTIRGEDDNENTEENRPPL